MIVNQYHPQSVTHPGMTLAEKLEELGMGPKEFALRANKPEKTIIAVLKGDSAITADMAVQFENVTRIPAHYWMNHQRGYDEYLAREKQKQVIKQSTPWARSFPISEMVKKGWLPMCNTAEEKTIAVLAFFGFAHHAAWEDYYFNQQLKVAFRISLSSTKEPYAISAWLRKGELQAETLEAASYDEKKFKETLPAIKALMANHPADFFARLQTICLSCGVKVVYTPTLPKAPLCGSTRWLNDTPLIQLSGRYKRYDSFWFTFFHEAGHILLHGKKDIFLEDVEYSDKDMQKEEEANQFAIRWTLTQEDEDRITDALEISLPSTAMIRELAQKFNTHPAIVIGRLQHKKRLPYTFGKEFLEPVVLD